MTKVYFSKDIETILDRVDFSRLGKRVAIKIHFGEKGCTTYIKPELVKKVYERVKKEGKEASLVECNVLYRGSRTNKISHIKTANEHGFDFATIDILDGERGEQFIEVNGCKLGKGIKNYDSLIVISHFKGHMAAGFGGSLKNIGMGLASRAGKLAMHSSVKPSISEKCTACGVCMESCNANAISIVNGKAQIDTKKCEGCAMCIAACPNNAVLIPWGSGTSEELQNNVSKYASAVLGQFPNSVFINVLESITKDCDCFGIVQKLEIPDLGILMSKDIVSVEKASLDLSNSAGFDKIQPGIDKNKQVELAEKLGLGSSNYELVRLD